MTSNTSNNSECGLECASLGRCLVLGGTGFLGHALAQNLLECNATAVQVFSRHIPEDLQSRGVKCFQGDIRDKTSLLDVMRGCQTVFHTISCCDIWGKKEKFYSINVDGTANVLECAKKCGVQRLIYTGTPSVVVGDCDISNGDEHLPYASSYSAYYPATKRVAEEMVLAANDTLRVCALRPHLIWGHRDPHILPNIARAALSGKFRQIGDGKNVVSITHITNAVYGHIMAALELCGHAANAGKAYFICDEKPVNLWQWIREYLALAGLPPIQGSIGRHAAMALAWFSEISAKILPGDTPPRLTRFVVQQLTQSHSFSWFSANRDFGYKPIIGNDAGLAETIGLIE